MAQSPVADVFVRVRKKQNMPISAGRAHHCSPSISGRRRGLRCAYAPAGARSCVRGVERRLASRLVVERKSRRSAHCSRARVAPESPVIQKLSLLCSPPCNVARGERSMLCANITVDPAFLVVSSSPSAAACCVGAERRHPRPRRGRPGVSSAVRGSRGVDAGGGESGSRGSRVSKVGGWVLGSGAGGGRWVGCYHRDGVAP